ncbi:MAG: PqqD family protein [Caldilineaceae bacterium]|nr:PqqD family protein [Caldilineaceae bacterium]
MATKTEIHLATRVQQSPNPIATSPVDEDLMMFSQERNSYFALKGPARAIWERIAQPIVVEQLCEELTAEFDDVDIDECQRDVIAFLTELQDEGLIRIID